MCLIFSPILRVNIKNYALYRFFANDSKEDFFMKTQNKKMSTETMVIGAVLTALVVILQYVSMVVKISSVPITLVLVPVAAWVHGLV